MAETAKSSSMMMPLLIGGGLVFALVIYFMFIKKSTPTMAPGQIPGQMPGQPGGQAALVGQAAGGLMQTGASVAALLGK